MFIGIDHGTSAIRFSAGEKYFKITREEARNFRWQDLGKLCSPEEITGIALTYSMGDGISRITPIERVEGRGIRSREGAGKHVGGGTQVFDQIRESGLPAVLIPGLHRNSPTDARFRVYSHQASPEKIGIAYRVSEDLGRDFIVSDVSSNTVTLLVKDGLIAGGFDACIFAPGLEHGALDVDAIRRVDTAMSTANEAFLRAGVNYTLPESERLPALALFSAMECAALRILNQGARIALAGSIGPLISHDVSDLLGSEVEVYDEWCASSGLALIAKDVFSGKREILGIGVDNVNF